MQLSYKWKEIPTMKNTNATSLQILVLVLVVIIIS